MTPRLVTIAVSHYCEKARWALDRLGLAYDEECHPPALHALTALRTGGRRTVPVLVTDEGTFPDSSEILAHLDRSAPPEGRLYPTEEEARREVEALEERFDEALGPHVRRWAYAHLLDRKDLVAPFACHGVRRRSERVAFRWGYPVLKALMRKAMHISPESAERSRQRIEEVLAEVDARLADGRRYLAGERFTAADLTFAALAAPALCPPEYGGPYLPLADLPPAMRADVERWRETPAGRLGLRLYGEERRAPAPAGAA